MIVKKQFKKGFTLIEVMIAVTLFTVIMTIGTGALINTNATYRKTESMRAIIDNLHFVMEDMARSLRTGSGYDSSLTPSAVKFTAVNGDAVIYGIDPDGKIVKNVNGAPNYSVMSAAGVTVDVDKSGFFVEGEVAGDDKQPRVVIRLAGTITAKEDVTTSFNIQTTVSQRLLDL